MTCFLPFDEINRLISTSELQTICKNIEKTFFATSFVPFFAVFSADMQL